MAVAAAVLGRSQIVGMPMGVGVPVIMRVSVAGGMAMRSFVCLMKHKEADQVH